MPKTISLDHMFSGAIGFFSSVGGGITLLLLAIMVVVYQQKVRPQLPVIRARLRQAPQLQQMADAMATLPASASAFHSALVRPVVQSDELSLAIVPGAGHAMLNPPTGIEAAIAYMTADYSAQYTNAARYLVPLGWYVDDNAVRLAWGYLVGPSNFNHFLVTGQNDSGKDNFILWAILCLLFQHTPDELELWVIDPKGLDWGIFRNKAHVKMLHIGADNVDIAMANITHERQRRMKLIQSLQEETGARKWESLPDGKRPPLMVLIITELTALRVEAGDKPFDKWMSNELSQLRAFGGRSFIGTQNANNLGTNWRGQISVFAGGYQPRAIYDEPCMNLTAPEIIALGKRSGLGAVPPSQLQKSVEVNGKIVSAQGVMTLIAPPDEGLTIRTSYISDEAFVNYLTKLPDRPAAPARDTYEEEPLSNAQRSAQFPVDEPPTTPPTREFPGSGMGYGDIADYIAARRTDDPKVSQARIEVELFGYSAGAAARAVKAAILVLEARQRTTTTTDEPAETPENTVVAPDSVVVEATEPVVAPEESVVVAITEPVVEPETPEIGG